MVLAVHSTCPECDGRLRKIVARAGGEIQHQITWPTGTEFQIAFPDPALDALLQAMSQSGGFRLRTEQ